MPGLELIVRTSSTNNIWSNVKETPAQEEKTSFVEYTSPLSTGPFLINFYFESKYKIDAKRYLANGLILNLVPDVDYTISGSNLTLSTALQANEKLYIGIEQSQAIWGKEGKFTLRTFQTESFIGSGGSESNFDTEERPLWTYDFSQICSNSYVANNYQHCRKSNDPKNNLSELDNSLLSGEVYAEIERGTHIKRITNPLDDTQYVDVEVIDWISFGGTKNITLSFNNQDDEINQ